MVHFKTARRVIRDADDSECSITTAFETNNYPNDAIATYSVQRRIFDNVVYERLRQSYFFQTSACVGRTLLHDIVSIISWHQLFTGHDWVMPTGRD